MTNTNYYIKLPDDSFVSFDNPYEFAMFSGTKYTFSEVIMVFIKFGIIMLSFSIILWLVCLLFDIFF